MQEPTGEKIAAAASARLPNLRTAILPPDDGLPKASLRGVGVN